MRGNFKGFSLNFSECLKFGNFKLKFILLFNLLCNPLSTRNMQVHSQGCFFSHQLCVTKTSLSLLKKDADYVHQLFFEFPRTIYRKTSEIFWNRSDGDEKQKKMETEMGLQTLSSSFYVIALRQSERQIVIYIFISCAGVERVSLKSH